MSKTALNNNQCPIFKRYIRVCHFTRFERDGEAWLRVHTNCGEEGSFKIPPAYKKRFQHDGDHTWRCIVNHFGYIRLIKRIVN